MSKISKTIERINECLVAKNAYEALQICKAAIRRFEIAKDNNNASLLTIAAYSQFCDYNEFDCAIELLLRLLKLFASNSGADLHHDSLLRLIHPLECSPQHVIRAFENISSLSELPSLSPEFYLITAQAYAKEGNFFESLRCFRKSPAVAINQYSEAIIEWSSESSYGMYDFFAALEVLRLIQEKRCTYASQLLLHLHALSQPIWPADSPVIIATTLLLEAVKRKATPFIAQLYEQVQAQLKQYPEVTKLFKQISEQYGVQHVQSNPLAAMLRNMMAPSASVAPTTTPATDSAPQELD